jgi:hypothetical protein
MSKPEQVKNIFCSFIKNKLSEKKEEIEKNNKVHINYMSPGRSIISSLQSRYITMKRTFLFVTSFQTLLNIAFLISIMYMIYWVKNNQIVTIVPGASEIMKIRPGSFPDSSVYFFSENIADYVGTFSAINVDDHYRHVEQYMSAQTRQRFDMVWRSKIDEWRGRKLDQIFSYDTINKFDLNRGTNGEYIYKVDVKGIIKQYVDGQIFSEPEEKILHLEFKTKDVSSEKPWFFELTKFEWYSLQQFNSISKKK